jgi:hypothetical protein
MTPNTPPITFREMLAADPAYNAEIKKIDDGAAAWLSVKQTAIYLGKSVRQIRRYQRDGLMPPRKKVSRAFMYPRSELEKMKPSLSSKPAN